MGISRALRRVKRQAQRGGLGALRAGLGEELRSGAIPRPLRSAARRIAALIDPTAARSSTHQPGSTATPAVGRTPIETLRHAPPEQANKLGSDRGDAPTEPEAPSDSTQVDPISVGATPTYDATPIEVAPIDATPTDVTSADVVPVVVDADAVVELKEVFDAATDEAEAAIDAATVEPAAAVPSAEPKAKKKPTNGAPKPKSTASASPAQPKEKLAHAEEDAKSAARSGPRAKRSGGQGGKTSKKK